MATAEILEFYFEINRSSFKDLKDKLSSYELNGNTIYYSYLLNEEEKQLLNIKVQTGNSLNSSRSCSIFDNEKIYGLYEYDSDHKDTPRILENNYTLLPKKRAFCFSVEDNVESDYWLYYSKNTHESSSNVVNIFIIEISEDTAELLPNRTNGGDMNNYAKFVMIGDKKVSVVKGSDLSRYALGETSDDLNKFDDVEEVYPDKYYAVCGSNISFAGEISVPLEGATF